MATKKKPPAKKQVSHAKVVYTMYLDFMRLAGQPIPVKKIVMKKKPPAKKKPPEKIFIPHATTIVRKKKKQIVFKPPRRKGIPIGGIPQFVEPTKPPPPRESMPVSKHWTYFDKDGNVAAPWEIEIGPHVGTTYDDDEDSLEREEEGMFADEDYSYEDIEADWGGYEHSDTGYGDENA